MKILIVGFSRPGHMGLYLAAAARQLKIHYKVIDASDAEAANRILRSFCWHVCGKRPAYLNRFANEVLNVSAAMRPDVVLTTGRAPLHRSLIEKLRGLGTTVINYSTDDPWNPALRAPWFLRALRSYDTIYTTRRANLDDFFRYGIRTVQYLPFAYDPEIHRPWPADAPLGAPSDVLFVGGCDNDRLPLVEALIDSGMKMALFGGYWDRHSKTRAYWRGIAGQDTIRSTSAAAKICLCLVRRANRDGSVMRSFEAAAIGGCILVEDTADHRELFGPDDQAVRYFKTIDEMVRQAKLLLADAEARRHLATGLRARMAGGGNTYADRLATMLKIPNADNLSSHLKESSL